MALDLHFGMYVDAFDQKLTNKPAGRLANHHHRDRCVLVHLKLPGHGIVAFEGGARFHPSTSPSRQR
jgi:hypothetical protein